MSEANILAGINWIGVSEANGMTIYFPRFERSENLKNKLFIPA